MITSGKPLCIHIVYSNSVFDPQANLELSLFKCCSSNQRDIINVYFNYRFMAEILHLACINFRIGQTT